MNLIDLFSKKIALIIIASVIGIVVLFYKFNMLGILFPKKTTIEAIDQNNKDIKIYDEITIDLDSIAISKDSISNR